jgi:hypothetical protein
VTARHIACPLLFWALGSLTAGCGQKGPPLPPLRLVPAAVADLSAHRVGSTVRLQLTVPARNQDGSTPADLGLLEVYGLTGDVSLPDLPPDAFLFKKRGTLIGRIEVQPPIDPEAAGEEEEEAGANETPSEPGQAPIVEDLRPVQGAAVRVLETLAPDALEPLDFSADRLARAPLVEPDPPLIPPLWPLPGAGGLRRYYVVVGVSSKGRIGPASARAALPLRETPPPPEAAPSIQYTETAVTLEWVPPPAAVLPIQEPAGVDELPARPLVPQPPPYTFNVYEVPSGEDGPDPLQPPLSPQPVALFTFDDPRVAFGVERCYVVRTVQTVGGATMESEASPVACVTPIDTFAPTAPRGLAAVGSEGVISLIWEPSPERDVAGYLVLRGESPGDTLRQLTEAPVLDTTYRDTALVAGTRYVYAVVAVDKATPANRSPESNRVEESAR